MPEDDHRNSRWSARPRVALAIRVLVFVVPFAASIAAVQVLGRLVPRPAGSGWFGVGWSVLWWVGLAAAGAGTLVLVDKAARRVLPLSALLQLSLVFPDEAPSRYSVAMRAGTTRQLERTLANLDEHGLGDTPAEAAAELLALVSALSAHDRLTRGHCERVRAYCDLIADELQLSPDDRSRLHWSGLLHDIGKLRVPAEILNKRGRPTDEEWEALKRHPEEGARLVAPLAAWLGDWSLAVVQHHERWDGAGYPHQLAGNEISLAGRIVSVADAFDVMTSVRSYQKPRSAVDARAELVRCSGTQFDPDIVRAFLNISIGRLRLAMGPLSALSNVVAGPHTALIPAIGPAATGLASVAVVTLGAFTAGLTGHVAPQASAEGAPTHATVAARHRAEAAPSSRPTHTSTAPDASPGSTTADDGSPPSTPTPTSSSDDTDGSAPSDGTGAGGRSTTTTSPARRDTTTTTRPSTTGSPTRPAPPGGGTGAIPTTTAPPTTAPTPAPAPTTVVTQTLYLTNPGTGNTTTNAQSSFSLTFPSAGALANYDTDRDSSVGRTLERGSGIGETDARRNQRWSTGVGVRVLAGPASLQIWAAVEDFRTDKLGTLMAALQACTPSFSSCRTLATANATVNQTTAPGGFLAVNANFGSVLASTTSTEVLSVKLVVATSSEDDLWFAYDTAAYPSALTITGV